MSSGEYDEYFGIYYAQHSCTYIIYCYVTFSHIVMVLFLHAYIKSNTSLTLEGEWKLRLLAQSIYFS